MPIDEGSAETQLDAFRTDGRTALMNAAAAGDEEQVRMLLDAGADIHAVDNDGDGALSYAMRSRSVAVLEMLIRRGANPNAVNNSTQHELSTVIHPCWQVRHKEAAMSDRLAVGNSTQRSLGALPRASQFLSEWAS